MVEASTKWLLVAFIMWTVCTSMFDGNLVEMAPTTSTLPKCQDVMIDNFTEKFRCQNPDNVAWTMTKDLKIPECKCPGASVCDAQGVVNGATEDEVPPLNKFKFKCISEKVENKIKEDLAHYREGPLLED